MPSVPWKGPESPHLGRPLWRIGVIWARVLQWLVVCLSYCGLLLGDAQGKKARRKKDLPPPRRGPKKKPSKYDKKAPSFLSLDLYYIGLTAKWDAKLRGTVE